MSVLLEEYSDVIIAILCGSASLSAFLSILPTLYEFANNVLLQMAK